MTTRGHHVTIRPETAADKGAIRDINIAAFRSHPFSQQTEHLIVEALRDAGALELSLVAELAGTVVGHVAFSRASIEDASDWYLLGPIAVDPAYQGQGVGEALVEAGLALLTARGARGFALVGDPGYYGRFGFRRCEDLTYPGVPDEYVLCLPLDEEPTGELGHHAAFFVQSE